MALDLGGTARCPFCKKRGGLSYDFISNTIKCSNCSRTGIQESAVRAMIEADTVPDEKHVSVKGQEKKDAKKSVEKKPEAITDGGEVKDRGPDGRTITHYLPRKADRYIPRTREGDRLEAWCAFTRHRLRSLIRREQRYGRDDLRQRGFHVVNRKRDERNFIVRILSQEE